MNNSLLHEENVAKLLSHSTCTHEHRNLFIFNKDKLHFFSFSFIRPFSISLLNLNLRVECSNLNLEKTLRLTSQFKVMRKCKSYPFYYIRSEIPMSASSSH